MTLDSVASVLADALRESGYWEQVYYRIPDSNGIARVTRLERIEADGSPVAGQDRFIGALRSSTFSLGNYIKELLFEPAVFFAWVCSSCRIAHLCPIRR